MNSPSPVVPSLFPGDPAPWFKAFCAGNPQYSFSTAGGRYVALCFFGSAETEAAQKAVAAATARPDLFDEAKALFFGVTIDPRDRAERRVADADPGVRIVWDFDRAVSRLYGALVEADGQFGYRPHWLILDPQLRVMASFSLDATDAAIAFLDAAPPVERHGGVETHAPVLILPRVFEPGLCQALIAHYQANGGIDSGFMREVNGKTTAVVDHHFKRRSDCDISDEKLRAAARSRILRRVVPEIEKAFQFKTTRMERYIVACYDAAQSGFFNAHRDNTTKGTAHRRFAVTFNLNAEDFEGGELVFPEFGSRRYRAPTGGCVVFSCSLLHQALPVTKGRRFAFLPFLYDDAAAKIREENNRFLDDNVGKYVQEANA